MPSSCPKRARKRCASLITGLPRARANEAASCSASAAFTVKRSGFIMAAQLGNVRAQEGCPFGRTPYFTTIFLVKRLPSMTSW